MTIPSEMLDYSYSTWPPGTTVTLANVPWDNTYRDIVKFDSASVARDYIKSLSPAVVTVDKMTYAALGRPISLNIPFSRANTFNYIMVENAAMPINGDRATIFFYFINSVEYVAPNTTRINVQLDVWTTFQYYVRFGRSYVQRGHIGLYLEKHNTSNYGRNYLTVAEGQDLGTDFGVVGVNSTVIAGHSNYAVCIVSTIELTMPYGNVSDPKFTSASGSEAQHIPNGCSIYFVKPSEFRSLMRYLSDYPWVAQGIVSITLVPSTAIDFNSVAFRSSRPNGGGSSVTLYGTSGNVGITNNRRAAQWKNFRASIMAQVPPRYRHLTKFQCYPYSIVEVTTYSGNPLMIKPEMVGSDDLSITQWVDIVPPAPRVMYTVDSLGQFAAPTSTYNGWSEHLDSTTGVTNFPTTSVVNNSYLNYMASNAHSIAYQHDSADWSQQKALTAASNSYNMATTAISASNAGTNIQVGAANAQTALSNQTAQSHWGTNSLFGVGTGIVGGGLSGGIPGAVLGGLSAGVSAAQSYANMGIDNAARNASTAISNNAALAQQRINAGVATYNRDTNYEYAQYASNGDYANAIAGINAKTADAKMIQPTTSGQIGGDAFNFVATEMRLDIRLKMLNSGALARIGEFWLRYGYALNRPYTPPTSLQCMSKFTYWQMSETYLVGSTCPEVYRQAIRGIFEKGVTVWRRPEYIGATDWADNTVN